MIPPQNLWWTSNELEKKGVKLKATTAMLNRGTSVANTLARRGSRRLSTEGGMDDALQSKHSDDIKKANHLRKKLKAHHDEARTVLAKKLQVENARCDSYRNVAAFAAGEFSYSTMWLP